MKFMLNGAITLGTLDGANVEIADAAGKENELIFGMLTPEVNNLKRVGYHPNAFIMGDDVANSRMSLKNIANSGIFSADRAVLDYARDIWYASPVPMGK